MTPGDIRSDWMTVATYHRDVVTPILEQAAYEPAALPPVPAKVIAAAAWNGA